MSKSLAYFMLLFAFLLAACQPAPAAEQVVSVPGGQYTNIGPQQLNSMLNNKDFVFINVHIPFEGNIRSTDASIPYDEITDRLSELPADKNAKIVLYCRSGRMSAIAAEALVQEGYTNLWNLDGGMVEWERAGYPIEQ